MALMNAVAAQQGPPRPRVVARLVRSARFILAFGACPAGALAAQQVPEALNRLAGAAGAEVSFRPIPSPVHLYYVRPIDPKAIELIGVPLDKAAQRPPDTLLALGSLDGRCVDRVVRAGPWHDDVRTRAILPAWTAQLVEASDHALAFEEEECPRETYARDTKQGSDAKIIEWAASQIRPGLEDSLGISLDMHPLKGDTWILPDGSRETWIQLLFGPKGSPWWEGGYRVMVGIRHGEGQASRLLFRLGPVDGYASVPLALTDIDGDGIPEVFLDFSVATEEGRSIEGVVILHSTDGASYRVQHIVAGWSVDVD